MWELMPITWGKLESFTQAVTELKPPQYATPMSIPSTLYRGVCVRAAIQAGWFKDKNDPSIIDNLGASAVYKISQQVLDAHDEATTIDPN